MPFIARKTQLTRKQQDNVYFFNAQRHILKRAESWRCRVSEWFILPCEWWILVLFVRIPIMASFLAREKPDHWTPLAVLTAHALSRWQCCSVQYRSRTRTNQHRAKLLRNKSVLKFYRLCFLPLHKYLRPNYVHFWEKTILFACTMTFCTCTITYQTCSFIHNNIIP